MRYYLHHQLHQHNNIMNDPLVEQLEAIKPLVVSVTPIIKNKCREGLDLDLYVAEFYAKKTKDCKSQNREFKLTLPEFRRIMLTKKCFYSGVELTHSGCGNTNKTDELRFTDLTLERIDNTKGYVKGNVKAVAHGFNKWKSIIESPTNPLTFKDLYKFSDTLKKLGVK